MSTATEALKAAAALQSTGQLFAALDLLDAKPAPTAEERMVKAAISDALTERHGLDDELDAIFSDDEFTGTYTEALRLAMQAARRG